VLPVDVVPPNRRLGGVRSRVRPVCACARDGSSPRTEMSGLGERVRQATGVLGCRSQQRGRAHGTGGSTTQHHRGHRRRAEVPGSTLCSGPSGCSPVPSHVSPRSSGTGPAPAARGQTSLHSVSPRAEPNAVSFLFSRSHEQRKPRTISQRKGREALQEADGWVDAAAAARAHQEVWSWGGGVAGRGGQRAGGRDEPAGGRG